MRITVEALEINKLYTLDELKYVQGIKRTYKALGNNLYIAIILDSDLDDVTGINIRDKMPRSKRKKEMDIKEGLVPKEFDINYRLMRIKEIKGSEANRAKFRLYRMLARKEGVTNE